MFLQTNRGTTVWCLYDNSNKNPSTISNGYKRNLGDMVNSYDTDTF